LFVIFNFCVYVIVFFDLGTFCRHIVTRWFEKDGVYPDKYGRIYGGILMNCHQKRSLVTSTTTQTPPGRIFSSVQRQIEFQISYPGTRDLSKGRGHSSAPTLPSELSTRSSYHRDNEPQGEKMSTPPLLRAANTPTLYYSEPTHSSEQLTNQRNVESRAIELGKIHFRNETCLIVQASNQSAERVPSSDWIEENNQNQLFTLRQEYANNNATQLLQRSTIPPK